MSGYPRFPHLVALICFAVGTCFPLSATSMHDSKEIKAEPAEVASIFHLPKTDEVLELQTLKQSATVKTKLGAEVLIEGICLHCQINIKCSASELSKKCPVCPCELSNAQCLTGKTDVKSLTALLKALPTGTALRVEYTDTNKPEMGVKRLVVDRHKALFLVVGIDTVASEYLLKIGKSVGATDIERSEDGKRLQLTLKDDWTTEKEIRWEKALGKIGAKIVSATAQP